MDLNDRKQLILAAVVELYIDTGEPVSSKAVIDRIDMSVSSATIRNEMSELSVNGYLTQPHTSAGRIPTSKGFRYYVDNLMKRHDLSDSERRKIEELLPKKCGDPDEVLKNASTALSELTDCATLFTTPADNEAAVKRIDIIPINRRICLLLLQTSTGVIKNSICRLDCDLTPEFISIFQNAVLRHLYGIPLTDVSLALVQTITASLGEHSLMMSPLFVAVCDAASDASESRLNVGSESKLLSYSDHSGSMKRLIEFLDRRDLVHRLIIAASGKKPGAKSKIIIGRESPYEELENSSIILSKYQMGGKPVGSLGIIGPLRLDYSSLLSSVEYLCLMVGNILSELSENDPDNK